MRNRFVDSILSVAAVLTFAFPLLAQTPRAPKPSITASAPDLSGVWGLWMRPDDRGKARSFSEAPPMTPWAAEHYKALTEAAQHRDNRKDLVDPMIIACAPAGPTRITQTGRPFEIVQTPKRVLILYEWDHWVRHIWMDGRGHPKDSDPTWMGHSIGHWDGDTLVVDTVDINDQSWLDGFGHPHSEALHVVERFRRVNHDTLEVAVVYEDPKVYTKPWNGTVTFHLNPDANGELIEWVNCEDRINRLLKGDPCQLGVWELEAACKEREKLPNEK